MAAASPSTNSQNNKCKRFRFRRCFPVIRQQFPFASCRSSCLTEQPRRLPRSSVFAHVYSSRLLEPLYRSLISPFAKTRRAPLTVKTCHPFSCAPGLQRRTGRGCRAPSFKTFLPRKKKLQKSHFKCVRLRFD